VENTQNREPGGYTEGDLNSAYRKAAWRLLPVVGLLYLISFIDRANIGLAQEALEADLGIGAAAFGLGAGLFFVSYTLFEVPSNLILHRVGPRVWLARIMVSWGIVVTATMFVQGPVSFYILRFLLGVAEAGLFPGLVVYLSYWYSSGSRGRAIGRSLFWGLPLAFILGGPIGGLLLSLDGTWTLQGWQWLFFVEGLFTVAVGVVIFFYLADRPADASWLGSAEREALEASVLEENREQPGDVSVRQSFTDRGVLLLGLIFFFANFTLYGLTFWLPSIIREFGELSDITVGFLYALPWLFGLGSVFIITGIADRTGKHRQLSGASYLVMAVALVVAAAASPVVGLLALCVGVAGLLAGNAMFWVLPSGYLRGAAAAASIAFINSVANIAGFVSPFFLGLVADATGSVKPGLYVLAGGAVIGGGLLLFLFQRVRTDTVPQAPIE